MSRCMYMYICFSGDGEKSIVLGIDFCVYCRVVFCRVKVDVDFVICLISRSSLFCVFRRNIKR